MTPNPGNYISDLSRSFQMLRSPSAAPPSSPPMPAPALPPVTPTPPTDPDLLTLTQAAEFVQVHRQTIWRWRNNGLKVYVKGRVVRVKRADLEEFLGM
jgi:excisionase family DNA binding protein